MDNRHGIIPITVPIPTAIPLPVHVPTIALPPITIPRPGPTTIPITVPTITLPPITVPTIALSPITVPRPVLTTIPTITLPPTTVPIPLPTTIPITVPTPGPTTTSPPILEPIPVPVRQPKPVILGPWQVAWGERVRQILLRSHGYIDTSRMGSGKTYVALWIAQQFGFPLLIVCPVIMIDVWTRITTEYGIPVIAIISYQSLRSRKMHQPKHGLLTRHDTMTERRVRQLSFTPTPEYLHLVENGLMVICDEIQYIKNNSGQYKACNALLQPIVSRGGLSRFGLLSGTPFDKFEHAINLLRLIGYIRSNRLYTTDRTSHQLVLDGLQDLINACRLINAAETERILMATSLTKEAMPKLAYDLYTRIIKTDISGAMPIPVIPTRFDIANGFFNISPATYARLQVALQQLAAAAVWVRQNETLEVTASNFGELTLALVAVENAKVEIFTRVATSILTASPNNKVIISVNYHTTIQGLVQSLGEYHPLVLTGLVKAKERGNIIHAFNTNPNYRLLIMNTQVGGIGISLHDTTGLYPRFMLISPSYKMLEIMQAAGRIYRAGTLSDAVVRMIYGNIPGIREDRILNILAEKSDVLSGVLELDVNPDLILPGDYPMEIEAD